MMIKRIAIAAVAIAAVSTSVAVASTPDDPASTMYDAIDELIEEAPAICAAARQVAEDESLDADGAADATVSEAIDPYRDLRSVELAQVASFYRGVVAGCLAG